MERKGDILYDLLDSKTGQWETYEKATTAPDGTPLTDDVVANLSPLYRKSGTEYFRKAKFNTGEIISVKEFGAKGDGVTDDTAAVQAAINAITYSQFATIPGGVGTGHGVWGKATIFFPKGRYLLNSLTINNSFGVTFKGDSTHTTTLEYQGDTGSWFTFNGHLFTTFKDMTIYHAPTNPDPTTWANICFDLFPTDGGGNFKCENVYIQNFNVVKNIRGTTNNDNFICINCRFQGFNTYWLNPGNNNSLINKWYGCAWVHGHQTIFDVKFGGTYKIDGANIVHRGDVLTLREGSGLWAVDSDFHFDNIRMEWMVDTDGETVRTRLLNCDGSDITANVLFTNCGIYGGHPHVTRPNRFITHNGRVNVTFQDCAMSGTSGTGSPPPDIEVFRVPSFVGTPEDNTIGTPKIRFIGGSAITPDNVFVVDGSNPVSPFAIIEWQGCRNVLDQSKIGVFNLGSRNIERNIVKINGDSSNRLFRGVSPVDLEFLTHGEKTVINSIYLYGLSITGASDKIISFYSDSAKTNLIGTLTIPGGNKVNVGYNVQLSTVLIEEGLFISMNNPDNTGATGYFLIDYTNVGGAGNAQPGYFNTKHAPIQNDRIDFSKESQFENISADKAYPAPINAQNGSKTDVQITNTDVAPHTVTITGAPFPVGANNEIPAGGRAHISLQQINGVMDASIVVYEAETT